MTSPWPALNPNPLPGGPCVDIPTVYRRAAEVIDERGWCQGATVDEVRRVCAMGALRLAAFGSALSSSGSGRNEEQVLRPLEDHLPNLITVWNDAPGRTVDEVKDALRSVAAKCEAELAVAFRRPPGWRAS